MEPKIEFYTMTEPELAQVTGLEGEEPRKAYWYWIVAGRLLCSSFYEGDEVGKEEAYHALYRFLAGKLPKEITSKVAVLEDGDTVPF